MSFILDALKRSENERQEQAEAEFATVPSGSDSPAMPRWLWALGLLLAVNAIVLIGIMLRPDAPPAAAPAVVAQQTPAVASTSDTASFDDQVAAVRRNQSATESRQPEPQSQQSDMAASQSSPQQPAPAVSQPQQQTRNPVSVANLPVTQAAVLPTLTELRVNGTLQLPDLHVDIHVFNDVPSERFVFINMEKLEEGSQLSAGPVVREITSDGVILDYQNRTFLLPRE